MPEKILITDTLYMSDEDREFLKSKGYELVQHLDPTCPEDELCELVSDVSGYILGGIEVVTEKVAASAPSLRAIAFCGSGFSECIPSHESLTARGVKISNTAGSNSNSVAEFTLGLTIAAIKRFPLIQTEAIKSSETGAKFVIPNPREIESLNATVIGNGKIGSRITELLHCLNFKRVMTVERDPSSGSPELSGALPESDVVVVCVDKVNGENVLGGKELASLPDGALVVNTVFPEAVDQNSLYDELCSGRLYSAFDAPPSFSKKPLPFGQAVWSNAQAAYNTREAIERTNKWARTSLLNLLETGKDAKQAN